MNHAFCADEAIRHCRDFVLRPAKNDHLQAIFMREMDVHGGDRNRVGVVLNLDEMFAQLPHSV